MSLVGKKKKKNKEKKEKKIKKKRKKPCLFDHNKQNKNGGRFNKKYHVVLNINWQDSEYSRTPLDCACRYGHFEIVKLLLNDNRIDINQAKNDGATPFYIACQEGHVEIVKLLLNDKSVDINKVTNEGTTPFYIACCKGHIEVVKLLLNK